MLVAGGGFGVAEDEFWLDGVGGEGLGEDGFVESGWIVVRVGEGPGVVYVRKCSGERKSEAAVEDEYAVLDKGGGLDVHEGLVGVEDGGAGLEVVEVAGADEDWAVGGSVDGGGDVGENAGAEGVGGGEVDAGDAVVAGEDEGGDEVGEVAVGDVVVAEVGGGGEELLAPVGVGVG